MTEIVATQQFPSGDLTTAPAGQDVLGELVVAWLLTLRSEHSRLAYATDLGLRYEHAGSGYRLTRRGDVNGWLNHLDGLGVAVLAADEVHVNLWRDRLADAGYAPATIGRRLTTVSSLYRYLVRRRVLAGNPAEFATRVHVDRGRVATYSPHPTELAVILAAADGRDPRTSALVRLMLLTGVRVSEAIGADIEDLRTDGTRTSLTVTRKGGRIMEIPVPNDAAQAVRTYLEDRTSGPLFLSRTGRMSRSTARDLIRSVGIRAQVSDRMSPHSLRHGYANAAEAVGVPRTQIQADLGHLSSTTTDLYLHAGKRHEDFGGHQIAASLAKPKTRKRAA